MVSGFAKLEPLRTTTNTTMRAYGALSGLLWKKIVAGSLLKRSKAHRVAAEVPEDDMQRWKGNEAADKWVKIGAQDRNETWGNLVDKILTGNLYKARAVVTWLGQGEWPDGRALGKIKGMAARADFGQET